MPAWLAFQKRAIWIGGLALALAFLAADSTARLRLIAELQPAMAGVSVVDSTSPTGYAEGTRSMVVPGGGYDALHWVMHTQAMLAGEGARIRRVDYDNPPDGREVHWSSPFRWWLGTLAWIDYVATGRPLPIAVEHSAPVANALLFAIVLLTLTPVVARRFGAGPAAALALGMVAVRPFVSTFVVGDIDHHGVAALACLLTLLLLVGGGAGWVREADGGSGSDSAGAALAAWLPDRASARRWFVASGIAGGVGLWISAATATPVLIAIGAGALLSTGWCARGAANQRWSADPSLWRSWGLAGASASLVAYLIEYFPSHMGWRLEVNHPLFALSWAGAGELLFRGCLWIGGRRAIAGRRDAGIVVVSGIAALTLPVVLALTAEHTFWVADRFLWMLHQDYIAEFGSFIPYWNAVSWSERSSNVSALPIVCLAVPLIMLAGKWAQPAKAMLLLVWPAGLTVLALAIRQTRWWGMADGVWLAILVTTYVAVAFRSERRASRWQGLAGAIGLAWVVLPYPAERVHGWMTTGLHDIAEWDDMMSLATRDLARTLRSRGGPATVALADPSITTMLIYYGGVRGVGTLYWENLPGLKAAAAIYGAPTESEARARLRQHGVTHIVFSSWQLFAQEYALLSRGRRRGEPVPQDAYLLQVLRTGATPSWLRQYNYELPNHEVFRTERVSILEVVPGG